MNHGGGNGGIVALTAKVSAIVLTAAAPTLSDVAGGTGHFTLASLIIAAGGTGYSANDVLTLAGGTAGTVATITVNTVDGDGVILTASVTDIGDYTVKPTNPVSVTGGTGNADATFTLTWTTTSTTFYTRITLVFPFGEQNASVEASHATNSDRKLRIAAPAANAYATGYNVYVGETAGSETRQASNIAMSSTWTMPTSGLVSGAALPTTITLDGSVAQNYTVVLADSVTLANPANLTPGMELRLWLTQDATGSRVLSYGTQWQAAGTVSTIALSTDASAKDLISVIADTTTSVTARIQKAIAH